MSGNCKKIQGSEERLEGCLCREEVMQTISGLMKRDQYGRHSYCSVFGAQVYQKTPPLQWIFTCKGSQSRLVLLVDILK